VTVCYRVYCSDVELCKYFALYTHVFCCHCIIVYFNAVRSFDRKSEINHQFSSVQFRVRQLCLTVWITTVAGRFATLPVRYLNASLPGCFAIWMVRYLNASLPGWFVTRTFRHQDVSHLWTFRYQDASLPP